MLMACKARPVVEFGMMAQTFVFSFVSVCFVSVLSEVFDVVRSVSVRRHSSAYGLPFSSFAFPFLLFLR